AAVLLAAVRVLVGAALPVRPLDRGDHRAAFAAGFVGDAVRLRARQLPVARQRPLDRAVGNVAVAARGGLLVARHLARPGLRARAVVAFTATGPLLFSGRGTIGFVVDHVLPGGKDLLLHRFMIGVHLGGILLAGIGASFLARAAYGRITSAGWAHPIAAVALL